MKKPSFLFSKLFLILGVMLIISSCIKNNDTIAGDAKIKFFNVVSGGANKDFYLDSIKYASAVTYGSSPSYVVVPVNKFPDGQTYKFVVKNFNNTMGLKGSVDKLILVGRNYSAYYTKNRPTTDADSMIVVYEDDLKPDTAKAKVSFINLGYYLSSRIEITDSLNQYPQQSPLAYGERIGPILINIDEKAKRKNKFFFRNIDSTARNKKDTISGLTFSKGKIYTIIIDGTNKQQIVTRVTQNN